MGHKIFMFLQCWIDHPKENSRQDFSDGVSECLKLNWIGIVPGQPNEVLQFSSLPKNNL